MCFAFGDVPFKGAKELLRMGSGSTWPRFFSYLSCELSYKNAGMFSKTRQGYYHLEVLNMPKIHNLDQGESFDIHSC